MRKLFLLYYVPGAVCAGIAASAALFPDHRLWGTNHLSFLPAYGRVVALILIVVGMIPRINGLLFEALAGVARWSKKHPARVRVFTLSGVIIGLVLFLTFSSSTLLLGDGTYVAETLRIAAEDDSLGVGHYLREVAAKERVYAGTDMLYILVSKISARFGTNNTLHGVKVLTALLGALFLIIPLGFFWRSRMPFPGRLFVSGLMLTSGCLELFFGYVEVYAPMVLLAAAFAVAGFGVVFARRSIWWPTLCVVLGVAAHLQMLLLLPGLLFLFCYRRFGEGRRLAIFSGLIAAACIAASLGISKVGSIQRVVLPMWGSESAYGILSWAHILDVANEVMLIIPGVPLLAGLLLLLWYDAGGSLRARSLGLLRAIRSPDVLFALMLAIPGGLFLWGFRPELGMARDWDLFSICGVAIVAIAYVTARRIPRHRWDGLGTSSVLGVLITGAVLTSAWVIVNANEGMSVARYKSILRYDTTNAGYAYENLSLHFHDKGDVQGEIRALERALEFSPNPRYRFKLGLRYYAIGDKERAIAELRRTLQSRPGFGKARQFLVQMLYFSKKYEEMLLVCSEGERRAPRAPHYPFCVGQSYAALGRWSEARQAFARCQALGPAAALIRDMQDILRQAEDPGE